MTYIDGKNIHSMHKTIFKTYTKRLSKKDQCEGGVIFGVFVRE